MEISNIITLVTINSPIEILRKVIAFNSQDESLNKITVNVAHVSGFSLRGIPLKIDSDDNVIFTSLEKTISFIQLKNLVFIEILDPMIALEVLTDGAHFDISEKDVPTNLEVKRTFKNKSVALEDAFGFKVLTDIFDNGLLMDIEKYQLYQFLTILDEVIRQIAEDGLGDKALKELKEIKITTAEETIAVKKSANQLEIGINFKNKFSTDFKKRLKAALESKI